MPKRRFILRALTGPLYALSLCAFLNCHAGAATPPAGLAIEARLLTPLSSYTSKPGDIVRAVITTPVCVGEGDPEPPGATLQGVLKKVHRVGLGLVRETASLQLDLDDLVTADGRAFPIESRLTAIDNAREHVDSHGSIRGIRATATLSNRAGERLAFLAMGHPAAFLPLFAIESSLFHFPEPEIELSRGADLRLKVKFPSEWGDVSRCAVPEEISTEDWDKLHAVVDSLPYWSYSKRQPQPLDLVNLVFIGSEDEIERAFAAAGWMGARPNSMRAGIKAIRAIAENHALADAPMRTLLLDGVEPDIQLQKSLDTFEKRDHLRIWARNAEFEGRPVWASAATRDLAAVFSIRPFGFTHQIQDDVDLERDQVVSDLAFTGCVDTVAYVGRAETVRHSGEPYRRGILTDSRVAVVSLNSCREPEHNLADGGEFSQPGKIVRFIRRLTLTARNHYLRDNMVWRTADAVRLTFRSVRAWELERKNERDARAMDAKGAANPALRQDFAIIR